jgi:nicotinamide-nucleotide amidase
LKNSPTPNAAIITIGTEVTAGEIINANAASIAARLTDFGFICDLHLTVPDDRPLMSWSLEHAAKEHALIIVTGGLGPTTDDFTRNVISDITRKPLVWSEDAWQAIIRRLESVGAPFAESNKQQAFFPEGATIIANNHGTAAAFSIQHCNAVIVALPGPPREIEGIWNDSLQEILRPLALGVKGQTPLRWRCLGLSESKLGEIVEEALKDSGFVTGYRSHVPYIDIKVWVAVDRRSEFDASWRPKLETAINNWLVGRDADDAATGFLASLPLATPIFILDRATQGYLPKRIFACTIPPGSQLTIMTSEYSSPMPTLQEGAILVSISANKDTGVWQLSLTGGGPHKIYSEHSRYKGPAHAERLCAYIGERTLLLLQRWLIVPLLPSQ